MKGSKCGDEKSKYTDMKGYPLPVYKLEVTTTEVANCHKLVLGWNMGVRGEQQQGYLMREILSDPDPKVNGAEWWEVSH